ncbi:condensation domain-containing protein [Plantactinospora sp. KLBMP9567]|uniref:condensation domain-containing protein n=1 Tax=Plantactinospora sp. KLBMP9567 TaxID=3085900 RepID=UPI002981717E|nr:condensation domain-containing protein [Plantactinospora sp. KLBMP9567]MDW5330238.1 condensation domain-containing protein [Plantactinospora sp. KLBMP9567]
MRTAPLQHGFVQRSWLWHRTYGHDLWEAQRFALTVPPALGRADVARALSLTLERHEALRTTFSADQDGDPTQTVWPAEPVAPQEHTVSTVEDEEEVARRLHKAPFDVARDWPIRSALVTRDDVRTLYVVIAHIAADYAAASIVEEEMTQTLEAYATGGEPDLPAIGEQPADVAYAEQSPAGRAAEERALVHWRDELRQLPTGLLPVPVRPEHGGYVEAELLSKASTYAIHQLAKRDAVGHSAVFLAALCTALSVHTGQTVIPLGFTWGGRDPARLRRTVGSLFRDMVLRVDLSDRPAFRVAAARMQHLIYRNAKRMRFDMMRFVEQEIALDVQRGTRLRAGAFLNFVRLAAPPEDLDRTVPPPGPPWRHPIRRARVALRWRRLHAATELTVTRLAESEPYAVPNLYAEVFSSGPWLRTFVSAKESLLPAPAAEWLVRAVDHLLTRAARDGDLTFDRMTELIGGGTVRDARWVFLDHSWVHCGAVELLLLRHPGVASAQVLPHGSEDGGEALTARVAVRDPELTPADLRDFLLFHGDDRYAVACPVRFEIYADPGSGSSAGGERSDWSGLALLAAGDGRGDGPRRPGTAAETALRDAVAEANGLTDVDLAAQYVTAGGRLERLPLVLTALRRRGFTGVRLEDFWRPSRLATLATQLSADPERGSGGSTPDQRSARTASG